VCVCVCVCACVCVEGGGGEFLFVHFCFFCLKFDHFSISFFSIYLGFFFLISTPMKTYVKPALTDRSHAEEKSSRGKEEEGEQILKTFTLSLLDTQLVKVSLEIFVLIFLFAVLRSVTLKSTFRRTKRRLFSNQPAPFSSFHGI